MDNSIYLGRQPILNLDGQLYGYELLFRSAQAQDRAVVSDDSAATASVITHAFGTLSLGKTLGNQKLFINVGEELLFSDALEFLSPGQVALEILETVSITPKSIARCQELRSKGFTLALDDVLEVTPAIQSMFPMVDIVKFLLQGDDWEAQAERLVQAARGHSLLLLAERVETREQFNRCAALGFSLFQGYFFTRPALLRGRTLNQDRATLLSLLNQILGGAEIGILEDAFRNAPALTINLLRLANSVAFGRHLQITSLRHAIVLMGRQQLQRWMQLLLFSTKDQQPLASNPLLQLAATRAYLMEKMAKFEKPSQQSLPELAFMVGIMSEVPAILDITLEDMLMQISNLPALVHDALLNRSGDLGRLLSIVRSLERLPENASGPDGQPIGVHDFRELRPSILNNLYCEAMAWAAALGQPADEHDETSPEPNA